jgi:glycosyltransferase involved in cell wall biosynthesis
MKILIVSSQDINSGAGRAAYRLCKALEQEGVNVKLLVRSKFATDWNIIGPTRRFDKIIALMLPFLDLAIFNIFYRKRKGVFSSSLFGSKFVWRTLVKYNPDVVHLHWVNAGTFKISHLPKIKKNIVWTMHDEWLYTGVCHVSNGCEKYAITCQSCPELKSNYKYDLSFFLHMRKKRIFNKDLQKSLTIVGLSNWIVQRAQKSKMISKIPLVHLPNCIDTDFFKPIDKAVAKDFFNLPLDKKVILFGAVNALSDKNKGFDLLEKALEGFKYRTDLIYLVLGASEKVESISGNTNIRIVSHKFDEETLVLLYNASDVTVVPSRQENLSNTIMESLACGTPVVAFNTGGNLDLIDHKKNGYLATSFDAIDLQNGLSFVLENKYYKRIMTNARNSIVESFSYSVVAKRYIGMYKNILKNDIT